MFKWLKLLRWLGPWCNQGRAPKISHHDEEVDFGTNKFRCRVYRPSRLSGAVVVLPGSPDGLDDARLDRFCQSWSQYSCWTSWIPRCKPLYSVRLD